MWVFKDNRLNKYKNFLNCVRLNFLLNFILEMSRLYIGYSKEVHSQIFLKNSKLKLENFIILFPYQRLVNTQFQPYTELCFC